jgi:hypothetical protein
MSEFVIWIAKNNEKMEKKVLKLKRILPQLSSIGGENVGKINSTWNLGITKFISPARAVYNFVIHDYWNSYEISK